MVHSTFGSILYCVISLLFFSNCVKYDCPSRCSCFSSTELNGAVMNCSFSGLSNISHFHFSTYYTESVRALFLSGNKLSLLPSDAFATFGGLKLLDLSNNNFYAFDSNAFDGLEVNLETLNLSKNPLKTLLRETFENFERLNFIDLGLTSMVCDCGLRRFLKFVKKTEIHLSAESKCALPRSMRDKHLKSLQMKKLPCNVESVFNASMFNLEPNVPKAVVEEDSYELRCFAEQSQPKQTIEWLLNDKSVEDDESVRISSSIVNGGTMQQSRVKIKHATIEHEGRWTCRLETDVAFADKTVFVSIWPKNITCPAEVVKTEKGAFHWKETSKGDVVVIPCPFLTSPNATEVARRLCGSKGRWEVVNEEDCGYSSKLVEHLLELNANFNLDDGDVFDDLFNLTKSQQIEFDSYSVDVLLRIVEKRTLRVKREKAALVIKIIDALAGLDIWRKNDANEIDFKLGERTLNVLKKLPPLKGFVTMTLPNLALCEFYVNSKEYAGILAAYFDEPSKQFLCASSSKFSINNAVIPTPKSSLELPPSLFNVEETSNASFRLIWFRSPAIFRQKIDRSLEMYLRPVRDVGIFGAFLGDSFNAYAAINLSAYPLKIRWKSASITKDVQVGRWFQQAKTWKNDECRMARDENGLAVFECPLSFGFFTLLTESSAAEEQFVHPIVFQPWMIVSSGFLAICLALTIFVYCVSIETVRISVKLRHCLMNFWLSSTLLTLMFSLGINQVSFEHVCLCVSIVFHFVLLLNWFWILLLSRTLHRKISKIVHPPPKSDEDGEESEEKMRRSKIIGMYSFAIGLSLMPVAFTLALSKTSDYLGDKSTCFLAAGNVMLGAVVMPCGLAFFVSICLMLRASCLLSTLNKRQLNSQSFVAEDERMDELQVLTPINHRNQREADAVSVASSAVDADGVYVGRHLSYAATLLFLTVLSTAFACLYVRPEPARFFAERGFAFYDVVVGGLFSATTIVFGFSVLWCYVLSRQNLPLVVSTIFRRKAKKKEAKPAENLRNGHLPNDVVRRRKKRERRPDAGEMMGTESFSHKVNAGVATSLVDDGQFNESRHSLATASVASGANASKSHRHQKAIARKYYDKRRSVNRGDSQSLSEAKAGSIKNLSTSMTDDNCGPSPVVTVEAEVQRENGRTSSTKYKQEVGKNKEQNGSVSESDGIRKSETCV